MSAVAVEAPAVVTERVLNTLHDRCDRCGVEALTAFSKNDTELLFCGHHTRRYEPGLVGQGFSITATKSVE